MVDIINIDYEDVENDSFENMFEMSQMLNVVNALWGGQWWWY